MTIQKRNIRKRKKVHKRNLNRQKKNKTFNTIMNMWKESI